MDKLTAIRIKQGNTYSNQIPISIKAEQVVWDSENTLDEVLGNVKEKNGSIQSIQTQLDQKVNQEENKGLSTNDYTNEEKNKLSEIAEGAQVNQNAFSKIRLGISEEEEINYIEAKNQEDSIQLVPTNKIIFTDVSEDTSQQKYNRIMIDLDTISNSSDWDMENNSNKLVEKGVIETQLDTKVNTDDFESQIGKINSKINDINTDIEVLSNGAIPAQESDPRDLPAMNSGQTGTIQSPNSTNHIAYASHVHPSDISKLDVDKISGLNDINNKGKVLIFNNTDASTIVPSPVSFISDVDNQIKNSNNPVKNSVIKTALDNKLSLNGGEMSGLIRFNSGGITFKDSNQNVNNQYYAIQEEDGDLFIGGDANNTNYHVGQVFINTGYDEATAQGNDSIYLQIPGTLTTPRVLHQGLTDIGNIGFSGKITLAQNKTETKGGGLDCNNSAIINNNGIYMNNDSVINWKSGNTLRAGDHDLFFNSSRIIYDNRLDCGTLTFDPNKRLIPSGNNYSDYAINLRGGDIIEFNSLWACASGLNAGMGGINWPNGLAWDSLFANSGKLYFAPNINANINNPTKYEVIHKNTLKDLINYNISKMFTSNTNGTNGGVAKSIQTFELPAGDWILTFTTLFPAELENGTDASSGFRAMWLADTANANNAISGATRVQVPAASGATTYLNCTFPVHLNTATTYYLTVKQNSGHFFEVSGYYRYMGIKKF